MSARLFDAEKLRISHATARKLRKKIKAQEGLVDLAKRTIESAQWELGRVREILGIGEGWNLPTHAHFIREELGALEALREDDKAARAVMQAREDESLEAAAIRFRAEHPKRKVKAKRR